MKHGNIFGFVFAMWMLILLGGGIVVVVLGPITISGFGELDYLLTSGIKAIVSIVLVVLWIFILSKMKNLIFRKKLNF